MMTGMEQGQGWTLRRVPALDGIRAVAVLMVMVCHFDHGQFTEGGVVGVTMFFTLSGFLITSLLLGEHSARGRIHVGRFYRSRALRLFPALAVLLALLVPLTLAGLPTGITTGLTLSVIGYASNWYLLATATDGQVHWSALSHTWSLAIEEQFYLVWPLVTIVALRRGRRTLLALSFAGAGICLLLALLPGASTLATYVSAYALFAGCAFAVWLRGRAVVRPPRWLATAALVLLVLTLPMRHQLVGFVLAPVLVLVAIWVVVHVPVPWLGSRIPVWIGRRSYGLYLWHVPIAWVMADIRGVPGVVTTSLGVALSFLYCAVSWTFVETPFLRLKKALDTEDRAPRATKKMTVV